MAKGRQVRVALFAAALLACTLRLAPQAEDIRFERISRDEGLSCNTIFNTLQDRNGFMWFATEIGLNKFDGNEFTVFRNVPGDPFSLSHGYLLTLYEDRAGILWAGTFGGGLNRYDPKQNRFQCYRHVPGQAGSLSNDTVGAILEDRDGTFWIGTDNGLNRLDRASGRFTRYPLTADRPGRGDHIHDIREGRDGALWIATYGGGIFRFDRASGKFTCYRHDPADPASLSNDYTYCVLEDGEGTLWIGSEGGLNRLDRRSGKFSLHLSGSTGAGALLRESVNAICADRNGLLWVGTSEGLVRLDNRNGSAAGDPAFPSASASLVGKVIYSIFEDRSGIIWVGTGGNGIHKFDPNQKRFSHIRSVPGDPDSLGNNLVYSFWEEPSGTLWIGTKDGLDRFDRAKNSWAHFRPIPGDPGSISRGDVRDILADHSGNLWLAVDGSGLNRFHVASGKVTVFRNELGNPRSLSYDRLRALLEDRSGNLWIGTFGGGLNRMDREKGTFTRYQFDENDPGSLSDNIVRAILEDRSGTLWIGTFGGGLNLMDRAIGKFIRYRHDPADPASLSNNYVLCLHEDRDGNIWLGTWGGGLNRLDSKKGTFSHFTMADGLPSNEILGILDDPSGNLWLMTNEGLSRFSPSTGQFRNYDVSDGLQGREFIGGCCYQSRSGEMFFGGANGFNAFFPQNIFDNRYVPPVRITSFKVLNRPFQLPHPVWEMAEIELSAQDYLFSFEFAALDYTAPEKNKYAYKLEGLIDDWIHTDAKRRLASFSLLPPGRYVFRVKGSNSDGIWNDEGVSLVIRVHGPWWRSWWFLALLVALVSLSVFQWQRTRIRRLAGKIKTEAAMEELFEACNITPREKEIVLLLLKGLSNKEIEERLFIELSTVKIHVHHIFKKLGVQSRTQLLRLFQNLHIK